MSRLFLGVPDRWNSNLETTLLSDVDRINFHTAHCDIIEAVALHFKNGNMVTRFTDGFLKNVYEKLIGRAREFGYYFGDMPKDERPQLFRTSSASQYGGNNIKFREVCITILSAIDEELARRDQLRSAVMQAS